MKRYLNSVYLLYLCFFIMLAMSAFTRNQNFALVDMASIKQIIHPEYSKGELLYDPHHHHNYIVAFAAKWLGLMDNLPAVAKIFWFLEMGLLTMVLIRLSNFLFKNDRLILVLIIMLFILLQPDTIDQHEMVWPLYLLAIYYFLKEKWLLSAVFTASIFYFHIGLAIWWFLPSCFALAIIALVYKRPSLKEVISYPFVAIILASPIIYFYLQRIQATEVNEFFIKYYYYRCWYSSSVLLAFSKASMKILITVLLPVAVFLIGYNRAKKAGYKNNNIILIAIGVLILYIVDFIFADILGNATAITLQLLRSIVTIEVLSYLFLAYLLAMQIKRGNYIFFLVFMLLSFYWHNIMGKFLGINNQDMALIGFYFVLLLYEIFKRHIHHFTECIYRAIDAGLKIGSLKNVAGRANQLFQRPIVIAVFLIFTITPKQALLKYFYDIPQGHRAIAWTAKEYLFKDIANFTNEKIKDENAILLTPFVDDDFEYYTNHKIFITHDAPLYNLTIRKKTFNFEDILENDLNYPSEKLFENYNDENFSKKWEGLWKNLNEDIIRHWKQKYKVTHVIREKELPLNLPIIYENQFYVVYKID